MLKSSIFFKFLRDFRWFWTDFHEILSDFLRFSWETLQIRSSSFFSKWHFWRWYLRWFRRDQALSSFCVLWLKMPPYFSFLLFLLFFNKKCKPLLDKPQTPGGSSIWIIEDHCVILYSAIWTFLRFADTCVFCTQNASSLSKVWCMWDSWSQRCHVIEIV